MRCNQRFFGQEHFERGTAGRDFCSKLNVLRPVMGQYGFAVDDRVPSILSDVGGLVQVKYNGMLSVVMWDDKRGGFAAWGPRGRCYYSLPHGRKHPVTEYFNLHLIEFKDLVFVGETYVVQKVGGKCYMTEFNKSMSIIKNPRSTSEVNRIRLAVFDYARKRDDGEYDRIMSNDKYIERFAQLSKGFGLPVGCDSNVVHLPDCLEIEGSFQDAHGDVQKFWDEFIGKRGFEGLVVHTNSGGDYKIKFRDTLDVAIIAFRMTGSERPCCEKCGSRFDAFWLRKLVRDGKVEKVEWFDRDGRLLGAQGPAGVWWGNGSLCPLCGGSFVKTAGPILGAKIALMTPEGDFVDIADGAQISPISPVLDLLEPLYEEKGYLWVKPEVVVEVSYQQLYLDSLRSVYRFMEGRYMKVGSRLGISLRPYGVRLREDKTVNPIDLRLEQASYFVEKVRRIQKNSGIQALLSEQRLSQ